MPNEEKTISQNNDLLLPEDDELLKDLSKSLDEEEQNLKKGYQSPLIKKREKQRLDLETLKREIPLVQEGNKATKLLASNKGGRSESRREELLATQRKGQDAKEKLFTAALPLIKVIAHKEWRRRQQWGSTITFEDLVQDATIGFLKGLESFKVESMDRSSTNYLGQWILVEMRRSSEIMDHDLQVSNEAGERFRKIRALRTRLAQDLGREPTPKEISTASRNPEYVTRPTMVGKVVKEGETRQTGKGVTEKQVLEEMESRNRVGTVARFVTTEDAENAPQGNGNHATVVDPERSKESSLTALDPAEQVAESHGQKIISNIVHEVLVEMKLPDEQTIIISLRFGLPPYDPEHSAREIATITGVHRERITKVLNAFTAEMAKPGGVFHYKISQYQEDDILALGLGWVLTTLGPWKNTYTPKGSLVSSILTSTKKNKTTPTDLTPIKTNEIRAWYRCTYHDKVFSRMYENRRRVLKKTSCPSCGNDALLEKVEGF